MPANSEVFLLMEEIKKWREKVKLYEALAEEAQNETLDQEPEGIKKMARIPDEDLLNEINFVNSELNDEERRLEDLRINPDEFDIWKQEFNSLLEKSHDLQEEINNLSDVNSDMKEQIIQLNIEMQEETQKMNHTSEILADIEFQLREIDRRKKEVTTSLQEMKLLLLDNEEKEVILNNELLSIQVLSVESKSLFKEVNDKCQGAKTKLELYMNKYSDCKKAIEAQMLQLSNLKNKTSILKLNPSSAAAENGKIFVDALEIRIKDLELIASILDRWSVNGKEIKVDLSFNQFYEIENLIAKHTEMRKTLLDILKTLKSRKIFSVFEDPQNKLNDLKKTLASLEAEFLCLDT